MPRRATLLLMMMMAGCSSPAPQGGAQTPPAAPVEPPQAQAAAPAAPQRYDLKGKIVSIDTAALRVTVDHEAIAGFMGAMTMAYPVKDAKELENLAAGQQVTANVVSSGTDYWLENIAPVIGR